MHFFNKFIKIKQRSRLTMIFIMVSAIFLYLLSQMMISEATGFFRQGVEKINLINHKTLTSHYHHRIKTLAGAIENHIASTNASGMINEINQVINDTNFIKELSVSRKQHLIFQYLETPSQNLTDEIRASNNFEIDSIHNDVITIVEPLFDGANKWGEIIVFVSTKEINRASVECQNEINNSIVQFRRNCIYVIVAMLLAISVIFYLHARELSGPLVKLTKSIKSFNFNEPNPKLESEINLTTGDEVGYLAQEFISMTRRLRDAYDNVSYSNKNLEAQVTQRTEELQLKNHTLELTNTNLQKEINYRIELEESLKHSKLIAEEANSAKSSFLANISHEARTPINGILGSVELLQQSTLNFRQEHLAENIKSSSKALLRTINDLLDASKIEMGKLTVHFEKCNISEIIAEAVDTVSSQIYKKNLHFSIASSATIPVFIKADKTRVLQVLINLLSNATKFTNEGYVRLQIRYYTLNDQDFIEFTVSDSGIGIPTNRQKSVFEAFVQANNSIARNYGGTGLGLSISNSFAELMNGKITLQSRPNLGSIFTFTIPTVAMSQERICDAMKEYTDRKIGIYVEKPILRRDAINRLKMLKMFGVDLYVKPDEGNDCETIICSLENNTLPDYVQNLLKKDPNIPIVILLKPNENLPSNLCIRCYPIILPLRRACCIRVLTMALNKADLQDKIIDNNLQIIPGTILLAEDNPINQDIFISMLRIIGYDPDLAEDGEKAIALAKQKKYDLILMDCEMPKMNGYDACTAILDEKNLSKNTKTPIIAITAYNTTSEMRRAFEVGMYDFVPKPISLEQLRATVEKYVLRDKNLFNDPVDLTWLRNNITSNEDKIIKYLNLFINSNKNTIYKIQDICKKDDGYKMIHKISGSAASLGITSISVPAAELEHLLRENIHTDVTEKCNFIIDAFNSLNKFTENYKEKIKNAQKNTCH